DTGDHSPVERDRTRGMSFSGGIGFFLQAEDGIRHFHVTGVQTCALPILALIDRAVARFAEVAGEPEPPARIHGDLWSGNLLWSGGRVVLIDPAAHGGHRETDLAMLALFGAPYLDRILGAYQEEWPLADGWRERVPLHQLHPLLVHVVLFGGVYHGGLMDAVARVLAL